MTRECLSIVFSSFYYNVDQNDSAYHLPNLSVWRFTTSSKIKPTEHEPNNLVNV